MSDWTTSKVIHYLIKNKGNISVCAREARVDRSNFYRLLRRHGIYVADYRGQTKAALMRRFMTNKYEVSSRVGKQIEETFIYHPLIGDQAERYQAIRDKAKELAYLIAHCTPEGREQSTALTHLQMATMMANAAIAVNERCGKI